MSGVMPTTLDVGAPPPGPTYKRAGHPIPAKGKGGTIEHKYSKPPTSHHD